MVERQSANGYAPAFSGAPSARFAQRRELRDNPAAIARAFMNDEQFRNSWESYIAGNTVARRAEPAYGPLTRVYLSGRDVAHLTDVPDDEPAQPLCAVASGRRWFGRNDARQEQRALELDVCQACTELARRINSDG